MARCPGCHADFGDLDGPVHRYIGANAACWHLYGTVLAGEVAGNTALTVDAYAAQHSGIESSQSKQSVAVHLVTLEAVLHRGISYRDAVNVRKDAKRAGSGDPTTNGSIHYLANGRRHSPMLRLGWCPMSGSRVFGSLESVASPDNRTVDRRGSQPIFCLSSWTPISSSVRPKNTCVAGV